MGKKSAETDNIYRYSNIFKAVVLLIFSIFYILKGARGAKKVLEWWITITLKEAISYMDHITIEVTGLATR